ncbi:acetolactate synthase [Aminipila luticellarii]|uniref:Acetolactate synthase n=1 Tax=Aminipila luticellarii TaxID=2507160 RepID=A0A410PW18_9FIRM|nr:acetolactate synthase [Aminipila luticellarii]QAT43131.1 acetolactate synthase [Aminipila luticellarii]
MKIIKQVTVFLQNEAGRLEELTEILGKNDINISAISVAEAAEFGIARMIVEDYEKAVRVLKERELSVNLVEVLCVETPDTSGALYEVLKRLSSAGINVSYMYGYSNNGTAPMIMKVNDPHRALTILNM